MSRRPKKTFSVVLVDGQYRVQCHETKELVSGKLKSKEFARKVLLNHVNTARFLETLPKMSKRTIAKLVKVFDGRLRPKKSPWTIEEARLVASLYGNRGQLFSENSNLYLTAYTHGWLDDICKNMKPSQKKNKFIFGVLNPNKALANLFDHSTHIDFALKNKGAYGVLRRFGIDTLELFENKDDAKYLQAVIKKLADEAVEKFTESKDV